jgi:hypothetical protein
VKACATQSSIAEPPPANPMPIGRPVRTKSPMMIGAKNL